MGSGLKPGETVSMEACAVSFPQTIFPTAEVWAREPQSQCLVEASTQYPAGPRCE